MTSRRRLLTALLLCTAAVALLVGTAIAHGRRPPAPRVPRIVHGAILRPLVGTLPVGSAVPAADVDLPRTFVDAEHGYALAFDDEADYVVQTSNGGQSWTTSSPAVHVDAAQAPLAVAFIGAASPKVIYAYGSAQAVDITSDGGVQWRRAIFPGDVVGAEPATQGRILVFAQQPGRGNPIDQYVTADGGRTWRRTTAFALA